MKDVSFLGWLKSVDPKTSWLTIRDEEGLVGIEKKLVKAVRESGYINVKAIYDVFFSVSEPWEEE